MMIQVAICDDDKKLATDLKHDLEQIGNNVQNVEIQVALYHSGEEFLCAVENGMIFHIIFMDIEMGDVDGIEVGIVLREKAEIDDTIIIYISNHENYAAELVNVGIYRFMQKPIKLNQLERYFTRALNQVLVAIERRKSRKKFHYNSHRELHSIAAEEIVYIKSINKILEIYAWSEKEKEINLLDKFYSNVTEAMKQLSDESFVKCSRSHIVNLNYAKLLTENNFTLIDINETKIKVNRTFSKEVKSAYAEFRGNQYG